MANDRVLGGANDDQLSGGLGADRLLGGDGNDRLDNTQGFNNVGSDGQVDLLDGGMATISW